MARSGRQDPKLETTLPAPGGDTAVNGPNNLEAVDAHALTVLFSPDPSVIGRCERLPSRRFELGRNPTPPGLALQDPLVSRLHATITWDPDGERFHLHDHGSRNGTALNGQEVEQEALAEGDVMRVGGTVLRFAHLDVNVVGWKAPAACLLKGRSRGLRRVLDAVRQVARSTIPVLVLGETGTGKELVARELHRVSARSGPFEAVNCAALPDALMESELFGHRRGAFSGAVRDQVGVLRAAHGGTVLLDEVGELAPTLQAKLLRVLDEHRVRPVGAETSQPIDVRFLAATNRDLPTMARAGEFRGDLYARLAGWTIPVPPLRRRPEDLLAIVRYTLEQEAPGVLYEVTGDFFEALALYDWPFNARELCAVVRAAAVMVPSGGALELEHLPAELRPHDRGKTSLPADDPVEIWLPPEGHVPTSRQMRALLTHYAGNITAIAAHTGRDRGQVYRWLRRYGLKPHSFRKRSDDGV